MQGVFNNVSCIFVRWRVQRLEKICASCRHFDTYNVRLGVMMARGAKNPQKKISVTSHRLLIVGPSKCPEYEPEMTYAATLQLNITTPKLN
ncbi:hypothetical protein TNCV_2313031 [Trichonephila clavipes]|nr:hypothetical protein TNCV_2313031 [Trichonephila clavipes]